MGAAPEGPCDDGGGLDLALRQACGDPADFLHRPADQRRLLRIIGRLLFGGAGMLALRRMAAIIAKASMTSETCRCQPCQERVSLWSRPSSFLAVSKLSSMAQRRPSTAPGFPFGSRPGTRWRRRPEHHPRYCGGSEGPWSTDRTGSRCIRRPRDRPVPDRPSRTAARPWLRPRPTNAARQRDQACRDLGRGPGNRGLVAPGIELAGGADAKHIALAGAPQRHLDRARTVHAVGRDPGKRHAGAMARSIIASARAGLVAKTVSGGTCAPAIRAGSLVHAWGRYSARSIKPCPCRET